MFNTKLVVVSILFCATFLLSALASDEIVGKEGEPNYSEMVTHFVGEYQDSEAVLKDESWTPSDLEKLLFNSLAIVYYARLDACRYSSEVIPRTNADLTSLTDLGFLPFWPGDPLNNWEPMVVVTPEDGFKANALCLAVCPPEYSSPLSDGGTGQVSFDLFIYGPDESFSSFASVIQVEANKAWSQIPEGAIYGLGFHMSSMEEIEEMKRLSAKYKAQQAETKPVDANCP